MPVWGVWLDDSFCFSTGGQSAKARNLAMNRHCVVTTEKADEAVIVEGVATAEVEREFLGRAGQLYAARYPPYILDTGLGPIFLAELRVVFGIVEAQWQPPRLVGFSDELPLSVPIVARRKNRRG